MFCFLFRNILDNLSYIVTIHALPQQDLVMTEMCFFVSCAGATWTSTVIYCKSTDLIQLPPTYVFTCSDSSNFIGFPCYSYVILWLAITVSANSLNLWHALYQLHRLFLQLTLFLLCSISAENIPSALYSSTARRNLPRPRCPKIKLELVMLFRMIVTGTDFQLKIF